MSSSIWSSHISPDKIIFFKKNIENIINIFLSCNRRRMEVNSQVISSEGDSEKGSTGDVVAS
jgi:hypothetical protein